MKAKKSMTLQPVVLPLADLEVNTGQVEGLPQNPRLIKDEKFKKLKKSIEDNPEMLALRELLVYPIGGGKYIIIGGNMRYNAMRELGYKDAPCKVIPEDTPVENLRAYTIKDNSGFGEWDMDMLANEWDVELLGEWGVDIPVETETSKLSKVEYSGVYYEPLDVPDIKLQDCINLDKFHEKCKALDEYDLTEEQKGVLRTFAYRFIKIDFEMVANYYTFQATDEEKKAIERLRLVLTDTGINGFIEDDLLRVTERVVLDEKEDEE